MGQNIGNPGKLDLKAPTLQGTGCTKLYLNTNSSNFEWGFKTSNHILSCYDGASHQPFLKMLQNNAAPVPNISAYLMLWRRLCCLGQQDQITLCTAWSGQKEESKKWMCHPQVHQTTTCVQKWGLQSCHSSAQSVFCLECGARHSPPGPDHFPFFIRSKPRAWSLVRGTWNGTS